MTCRGCAGTGVGQHVGVREAQIALLPFKMKNGKGSLLGLRVAALEARDRLVYQAPLELIVQEVRDRVQAGWWLVNPETDLSDATTARLRCSWCHGTGELQLSVASMERAVST